MTIGACAMCVEAPQWRVVLVIGAPAPYTADDVAPTWSDPQVVVCDVCKDQVRLADILTDTCWASLQRSYARVRGVLPSRARVFLALLALGSDEDRTVVAGLRG